MEKLRLRLLTLVAVLGLDIVRYSSAVPCDTNTWIKIPGTPVNPQQYMFYAYVNLDVCQSMCVNYQPCSGVVWDPSSNACYFDSSNIGARDNQTTSSYSYYYLIRSYSTCDENNYNCTFNWVSTRNFHGFGGANANRSSLVECIRACQDNSSCLIADWNYLETSCWFYHSLPYTGNEIGIDQFVKNCTNGLPTTTQSTKQPTVGPITTTVPTTTSTPASTISTVSTSTASTSPVSTSTVSTSTARTSMSSPTGTSTTSTTPTTSTTSPTTTSTTPTTITSSASTSRLSSPSATAATSTSSAPSTTTMSLCSTVSCMAPKTCAVVNGTAMCQCPSACPMQYAPVCGSDNKTYSNECAFQSYKCQNNLNISIAYQWACGEASPCSTVFCPPQKTCVAQGGSPMCQCPYACQMEYAPVCGSNNITYGNDCQFQFDKCQNNLTTSIKYQWACDQQNPCIARSCPYECQAHGGSATCVSPCDSVRCMAPRTCVVVNGTAVCQCPTACTKEYAPVCGSNNITYPNECEFHRDKCQNNLNISIAYQWACGLASPCINASCSNGCQARGGSAICASPSNWVDDGYSYPLAIKPAYIVLAGVGGGCILLVITAVVILCEYSLTKDKYTTAKSNDTTLRAHDSPYQDNPGYSDEPEGGMGQDEMDMNEVNEVEQDGKTYYNAEEVN